MKTITFTIPCKINDNSDEPNTETKSIVGTWRYERQGSAQYDVEYVFNADGTGTHTFINGSQKDVNEITYTTSGNILKYSYIDDGETYVFTYTVSEDGKTLTLSGNGPSMTLHKKTNSDNFDNPDTPSTPDGIERNVGDTLTAKTTEGVVMTFRVYNKDDKTVQVGGMQHYFLGTYYDTAVDINTEGVVTIPSSVLGYKVVGIGEDAFSNCSKITTVRFEEGSQVRILGEGSFFGCESLVTCYLPDSLKYICGSAFDSSGLKSITIPKGVVLIDEAAFYRCYHLSNVFFGSELETIGYLAFGECTSLDNIVIPEHVEKIQSGTFANCRALTHFKTGNGVKEIGVGVFHDCPNLDVLELGRNVYRIKESCLSFRNGETSTKVKVIKCLSPYPFELDENAFLINQKDYTIYNNTKLVVPRGCKSAYRNAVGWNLFKTIEEE